MGVNSKLDLQYTLTLFFTSVIWTHSPCIDPQPPNPINTPLFGTPQYFSCGLSRGFPAWMQATPMYTKWEGASIHVKICITPHYSLCRRRSSIKHGNFFDSGMNVWRIRNLYFFLFNLNEHQYVNAIEFIKLNIWHFFKFWWNMFLVEGVDLLLNS